MSAKYGRGKFDAHENYIRYMNMLVASEQFDGMPNAVSGNKINWQVSSGKTTSFYQYYLQRWDWWAAKADSLGLHGKGNENERFTIAARIINPTGYRACRLCGEDWNVGYFYLNDRLLNKLIYKCPKGAFFKWQPIDSAIHELKKYLSLQDLEEIFFKLFPERVKAFKTYGISKEAFEKTNYINSKAWLTPGYMGNPPDRLDGFHDYHFECRKNNDPGRFDSNMRTYNHDRRSFEFWAEGNWMVADTLYNAAGQGHCVLCPDGSASIKVSPDHIGPISCGFKQLPLFQAMCSAHNSAKNRRFTKRDVKILLDYEVMTNSSVASFQVRAHWDKYKMHMLNDFDTRSLSNSMRALQDSYFRILCHLWQNGYVRFICTLLGSKHAFDSVTFKELDTSELTFESYTITKKITPNRKSLFVRSIRIALESIAEYASKAVVDRKLVRNDLEDNSFFISTMLNKIKAVGFHGMDHTWSQQLPYSTSLERKEHIIACLTDSEEVPVQPEDALRFQILKECVDSIGINAQIRKI